MALSFSIQSMFCSFPWKDIISLLLVMTKCARGRKGQRDRNTIFGENVNSIAHKNRLSSNIHRLDVVFCCLRRLSLFAFHSIINTQTTHQKLNTNTIVNDWRLLSFSSARVRLFYKITFVRIVSTQFFPFFSCCVASCVPLTPSLPLTTMSAYDLRFCHWNSQML